MARMTDEEHLQHTGTRCPYCRSDEIEGYELNFKSGTISQEIICLNCDARWYDVYRLTGYEEVTPKGEGRVP